MNINDNINNNAHICHGHCQPLGSTHCLATRFFDLPWRDHGGVRWRNALRGLSAHTGRRRHVCCYHGVHSSSSHRIGSFYRPGGTHTRLGNGWTGHQRFGNEGHQLLDRLLPLKGNNTAEITIAVVVVIASREVLTNHALD